MKARVFLSLALALPRGPQFHRADDARHAGRHRPACRHRGDRGQRRRRAPDAGPARPAAGSAAFICTRTATAARPWLTARLRRRGGRALGSGRPRTSPGASAGPRRRQGPPGRPAPPGSFRRWQRPRRRGCAPPEGQRLQGPQPHDPCRRRQLQRRPRRWAAAERASSAASCTEPPRLPGAPEAAPARVRPAAVHGHAQLPAGAALLDRLAE